MARGINKVFIIGHLGKDPVHKLATFGSIVTGSVATTEPIKDKDGVWTDKTEWHQCVFKGNQADYVRDYAQKGSKLYIEGKNRTRRWKDKNHPDITHYRTEVLVDRVEVLDRQDSSQGEGS